MNENDKFKLNPVSDGNFVTYPHIKSRNCVMAVTFYVDKKDTNISALNVLAGLLTSYPKKFKSNRAKIKEEMLLCNSSCVFSCFNDTTNYSFMMLVGCCSNSYTHALTNIEKKVLKFALDILKKGPKTDPVSMTLVKGRMIRSTEDLKGSADYKVLNGLQKNFLPECVDLGLPMGEEEQIKAVTDKDVLKALDLVLKAKHNVCEVGFDHETNLIKRALKGEPYFRTEKKDVLVKGPMQDLSISVDSPSTVVAILYKLKKHSFHDFKERMISTVFLAMLSSPDSFLFKEVREKYGFTYGISVESIADGQVLSASFHTDPASVKVAIKVVDSLLLDNNKYLTKEVFQNVVKGMLSSYEKNLNRASQLVPFLSSRFESKLPLDLKDSVEMLQLITFQDVLDFGKEISKVGSFTAVGQFKGGVK